MLQPFLFAVDVEMDDKEIKQGVPDPLKLEELLDSQEEGTEVDDDEQGNKNIPSDRADSNVEGEPTEKVDNAEQQNKTPTSDRADSNMEEKHLEEVGNDEQQIKNVPSDGADSNMEEKHPDDEQQNKNLTSDGADTEKLCDTNKERSNTKTCDKCTI